MGDEEKLVIEQPIPEENESETANEADSLSPKEEKSVGDWLSAGTSWGSSWLQTAKQKTIHTLELVKKDLDEFKEVMSQEVTEMTTAAKEGLGTVGAQVKQQAHYLEKLVTPDEESGPPVSESEIPQCESDQASQEGKVSASASMGFGWMKSLVDTVKQLAVEDTTEGEDEITQAIRAPAMRRTNLPKVKFEGIQRDESTYLVEPENKEMFEEWLQKFSMEEHDGEITMLLSNTPALRQIYAKLVPSSVDNFTFWSRYFYKVELAEIDEDMKFTLKELTINTELKQKIAHKDKKKDGDSPASDSTQRSEPTSAERSVDDWSDCGKDAHDIEELQSTDGGDETEIEENVEKQITSSEGPKTPRATDGDNKEDGWVDWDD